MFKYLTFCLLLLVSISPVFAQEDPASYIPPEDPAVQKKLDHWQDMKFGLMMHWGTYSQWGEVESWSICNEDWIQRKKGHYQNYDQYKRDYENLKTTFNPTGFDPEKWAQAAKEAGMKYVVFTTKHHDGFCMFDTQQTDYKITSAECPFHTNPKANVTKVIFDAFRKDDFKIGAYFSKPDWHSENYWWPYYATPDRHVNYDPAKYPDRWKKFQDYTYNQIEELMTGYGTIDVLWLDGAWVRPRKNMPEEFKEWAEKKAYDQDVNIPRIAKMARQHQPGLLVVDRWVSGPTLNFRYQRCIIVIVRSIQSYAEWILLEAGVCSPFNERNADGTKGERAK